VVVVEVRAVQFCFDRPHLGVAQDRMTIAKVVASDVRLQQMEERTIAIL
jgi:hypothetical protein